MNNEADRNISIRNSITIIFIASMVISVGLIGYMVFSNWVSSAGVTTEKIAEDMNANIVYQVNDFMNLPRQINEVNVKLIENGILDLNNETDREKFFVGVLQSCDEYIYSFSYGAENGEYYGARRNQNGNIEIMRNNAKTGGQSWYYSITDKMTAGDLVAKMGKFDPRTRDWYIAAKETKSPIFSPIYKHFVMPDLTISAAWPVYNRNKSIQGVLGTHIILSDMDKYLEKIVRDKNGFAVIIEKKSQKLIANSLNMNNFKTTEDGNISRYGLSDIRNVDIERAYEQYKTTKQSKFLFDSKNTDLYFNFVDYQKEGLDWVIITAIPESMLMSDVTHNIRLSLFLVILAILLSVAVYYFITNKLIKPINDLINATERFSLGDLTQRAVIVRNDEVGIISKAFNKMANTIYLLVNDLENKIKERTMELNETNRALEENKNQLQLILNSTAEAIYGINLEGSITFCNTRCIELLGYSDQSELVGKNTHWLIHHSSKDGKPYPISECRIMQSLNQGKGIHADDDVFWRADGKSFDVEYYSYPQFNNGNVIGSVITFMDITERKKNVEQIKYLSNHDFLTGLINRHYFEDLIKEYDTKENLPITVIYADLNGLKLTNDIFGHTSGDLLIKKSAEVLKKSCRDGDIVSRVGGDEFIILLPHTESGDAEKIIERVKSELSKEKVNAIRCSMALGYTTKISSHQDIDRIIEKAEKEMYREKSTTRKKFGADTLDTIMATLHERSPLEKRHSEEVSSLCGRMAKAMGLSETEIKKIKDAGYLHDIGKIVIDKNILTKRSTLSEIKNQKIEQHAVIGYRILNLFEDTVDLAEGIFYHHEKWDGSGYPKGLKGEEIPLISRIISLAENYDRKMSRVGVLESGTRENVINEIREDAGKRFDPALTEVLIKIIEQNI